MIHGRIMPVSCALGCRWSLLTGITSRAGTTFSRRQFSAAGSELVLLEKKDNGVAILTLNRPKALNALSDGLMKELVAKLQEVDADETLRASVVTGTGKAFAAGADIKEMGSRQGYSDVRADNMLSHWSGVSDVRKPIVAAVNGFALGGGCELAMSCDIIIAAEGAKFGQPEIKLGTIPGVGGTQRLIKAIGKSKAMELVLTGDIMSAADAERAGLVSRVVPNENVVEEAVKVATKIASFSTPVAQLAKECVNAAHEMSLNDGLRFERGLFHATWGLQDRKEGFQAFVEKRDPTWKHA
jgi:enoyl-CoA hydratase/carnithine racemase